MAIGTVQKILGSVTRVSQTEFKANYGDDAGNKQAGVFPSLRDAQAVIERGALGGKRGNWERNLREDGVESYLLKTIVEKLPTGLGYIAVNGTSVNVVPVSSPYGFGSVAGYTDAGVSTAIPVWTGLSVLDGKLQVIPGVYSGDYLTFNASDNLWYTSTQLCGTSIRLGQNAGRTSQAQGAVAVGVNAGNTSQGLNATAVGNEAGYVTQGDGAVAVGRQAGNTSQGAQAVAIGQEAGLTSQAAGAVCVGYKAGSGSQGSQAVAVGFEAGLTSQSQGAVALGRLCGRTSQGIHCVAVGNQAGTLNQSDYGIAIGFQCGTTSQGQNAVAMGFWAGQTNQATNSVAIGYTAGQTTQSIGAVALGWGAGNASQANYAVAIGALAGQTSQAANSIVINATGANVASAAASSCVIKPVRSRTVAQQTATMQTMAYDTSTGELVSLASAPVPAALGGYKSITSADSPYTATATDYFIDLTSGTATVNLPTAVGIAGRVYHFKLSVSGQTMTIDPIGAQTIDGSATKAATVQWSTLSVISDGANWKAITANGFA